jgi:hypothetical protein
MKKLELRYRTWYKGIAPRPVKLQVPGWAGDSTDKCDGARPQPWHCTPFVEGSTYGLEMVYPFDTECRVVNDGGSIRFDGDFSAEAVPNIQFPPFMTFAPGHYGYTSALDICPPPGYVLRIEPHPRFYTDATGECPVPVAGHLQGEWWPRIFFIAFKSPRPGEAHVFRKGEPYASMLVLPRKVSYDIREMTNDEKRERARLEAAISNYAGEIATSRFKDHTGAVFDNKYKILRGAFEAGGVGGVNELLNNAAKKYTERNLGARGGKKPAKRVGRFVRVERKET